jgi:hypothetical protein
MLSGDPRLPENVRVWNRGSFLTDHMTYWENIDGFVLRVIRVCAETAGETWATSARISDARARWRVNVLRLTRWGNASLWIVIGILVLQRGYEQMVPGLHYVPEWLPNPVMRPALVVAMITLIGWFTYSASLFLWKQLTSNEQRNVIKDLTLLTGADGYVMGMMMILWSVALLASALQWWSPRTLLAMTSGIQAALSLTIGLTLVTALAWITSRVLLRASPPISEQPRD